MVPNIHFINSFQLSWRLNSSVKQLKQSFVALSITVIQIRIFWFTKLLKWFTETKHTQRFRNMYIMLKSIMFTYINKGPGAFG